MKQDWLEQAKRDHRDAERWRKLIRLCGYLQDDSQTIVKLFQDDATRTAFIAVGTGSRRKDYFVDGGSFEAAIDQAPDEGRDY